MQVKDRSWLTLTVTTAIQALVSMAALTMPVLASLIGASMGISSTIVAGALAAVVYLGAMLGTLLAGAMVQRWGAVRTSQLGLVLCAAGLGLASAGWMSMAFMGAFVIGLGYGPITPASSHLLVRSTAPRHMSLVFSIKQTGVPLGGLLAGALAPALGLLMGWRATLVALAVPCLVVAFASQGLRARLDRDSNPNAAMKWRRVFEPVGMVMKVAPLRRLALCSLLFTGAQLSVTAYSVVYLHEVLGVGLVEAGLMLSVAQCGGIMGRIGWGYASDAWMGARITLMVLAAVMASGALGMALLTVGSPAWVMTTVMLCFGAAAIGWNGVYLAEVARSAPKGLAAAATGGTLFFTFFGNVIAPLVLSGVVYALGGLREAYAFLVLPLLVAGLLMHRGTSRRPQDVAWREP